MASLRGSQCTYFGCARVPEEASDQCGFHTALRGPSKPRYVDGTGLARPCPVCNRRTRRETCSKRCQDVKRAAISNYLKTCSEPL